MDKRSKGGVQTEGGVLSVGVGGEADRQEECGGLLQCVWHRDLKISSERRPATYLYLVSSQTVGNTPETQ